MTWRSRALPAGTRAGRPPVIVDRDVRPRAPTGTWPAVLTSGPAAYLHVRTRPSPCRRTVDMPSRTTVTVRPPASPCRPSPHNRSAFSLTPTSAGSSTLNKGVLDVIDGYGSRAVGAGSAGQRSRPGISAGSYSRGSTGSDSRARTAKTGSWMRHSGSDRTVRSRDSMPRAYSRAASERLCPSSRSRSRSRLAGSV